MTRPGIEPRSARPLANPLLIQFDVVTYKIKYLYQLVSIMNIVINE